MNSVGLKIGIANDMPLAVEALPGADAVRAR